MISKFQDYWDGLHRSGAYLFKKIVLNLPFSDKLKDVLVSNFLLSDVSDEDRKAFHVYYRETLEELLRVWLWWHAIVLMLSWPLEFLLFSREIIVTYTIWRLGQFLIIIFALIDYNTTHFLKNNITFSYFFLVSLVIVLTGFLFGRVTSIGSPWFNVIYALPFLCLIPDVRMTTRILTAMYFSFLYLISFSLSNSSSIEIQAVTNVIFLLFYDVILAGVVTHLFFNLFKKSFLVQKELEKERERSEELLLNILPKEIAGELKNSNQMVADGYDEATVLFADIVNFTPLAEELSPSSVVTLLDDIMSSFDRIVESYDVEKIKTVGDEYFLVGGIPRKIDNHAIQTAEISIKMMNDIQKYKRKKGTPFNLRVGLHTGPVVAGVIGSEKFVYDCWGDTVNVGSRMESQGVPGKIQVTSATKKAIQDQVNGEKLFDFEKRGLISVKGKGEISTYFLSPKEYL